MLFEFPLDALSFLAPLIYFIGWEYWFFKDQSNFLKKKTTSQVESQWLHLWYGLVLLPVPKMCGKIQASFYETVANVAIIPVLIRIVLYCIGVIRDRARSRAEGHKPRPVLPSISKTMWGLPFWLSGFRNAAQPPVVVQTQQVPPPPQQQPAPPPPPDPTQQS